MTLFKEICGTPRENWLILPANVRYTYKLIPDANKKAKLDIGHTWFTKMARTQQQNVMETKPFHLITYRL